MPINQLYHTLIRQICEQRPNTRITQLRNFVWLMIGIYKSRCVHLSRIANQIPGPAKLLSITKRLRRFLDNPAIHVREWYEPIARQWLQVQWHTLGEIRLIVDGTKVGFGHQLLMVALAYRKRAIPIAWTWLKHKRGHSSAIKQMALLNYVRTLLPVGAAVFLVGDSEFGSVDVLKWLKQWHWFYVLRQKSDTKIWLEQDTAWKPFGCCFVNKAGQSHWLGHGYLTEKRIFPTRLLVHWKSGEDQPWCLATNLPDQEMTLRYYRRRMWIEEMFGDLKKHGFDLESTRLQNFLRLSRLTLVVVWLYVWLVSTGTHIVHRGLRHLVDRNDRRDLSIFQIGFRSIQRCLNNASSFNISLCIYEFTAKR